MSNRVVPKQIENNACFIGKILASNQCVLWEIKWSAEYGHILILYVFQAFQKSNKDLGCSITFTTSDDKINRIKASGETNSLKMEDQEEEEDYNEEILTHGNLMAFAWHICQGMVSKPPVLSYFSWEKCTSSEEKNRLLLLGSTNGLLPAD